MDYTLKVLDPKILGRYLVEFIQTIIDFSPFRSIAIDLNLMNMLSTSSLISMMSMNLYRSMVLTSYLYKST